MVGWGRRLGKGVWSVRYVGVDLAWSPGRPSGVAVLDEQGRIEEAAYLTDLDALAAFCLARRAAGPVLVAVDAPLRVPNEHGQRPAERELLRLFGRFHLGAHVASRSRLLRVHGCLRGEQLVALLAQAFEASPDGWGWRAPDGCAVVEVYPHAALIAWFGLERPLAYKRGSLAARRQGLARLVQLLGELRSADPPLQLHGAAWLPPPDGWEELGSAQVRHLEGLLDAVICAHAAHYYHRWGSARCRVLGSRETGQIVTPLPQGVAPVPPVNASEVSRPQNPGAVPGLGAPGPQTAAGSARWAARSSPGRSPRPPGRH